MKRCRNGREIDGKCIRTFKNLEQQIDEGVTTKGEYANQYLKGIVFDYALPHDWLYYFCKRTGNDYFNVQRSTFWVYPKRGGLAGRPFSMDERVNRDLHEEGY